MKTILVVNHFGNEEDCNGFCILWKRINIFHDLKVGAKRTISRSPWTTYNMHLYASFPMKFVTSDNGGWTKSLTRWFAHLPAVVVHNLVVKVIQVARLFANSPMAAGFNMASLATGRRTAIPKKRAPFLHVYRNLKIGSMIWCYRIEHF